MKKLMNLAIASYLFEEGFQSDYNRIKVFLEDNKMDGLEVILYGDYDVDVMPDQMIYGHHLLYWPNWIDFWLGNSDVLMEQFEHEDNIEAYYGVKDRDGMIAYLRNEFELAKQMGVAYMVFHVSHVSFEEVFTFQHDYSDQDVLEISLELINEVFQGEGPLLLFENLWWPGLTYLDKERTEWFLSQVSYDNKGLLLDVAHLMGTNSGINTVDDGIDYVHNVLDDLGDTCNWIKAIHLSKTIAGPYLREDHSERLKLYRDKEKFVDGFSTIYQHIQAIDGHQPFDDRRIMEVIDRLDPDYLVYEMSAKTVGELEGMIQEQQLYIDGTESSSNITKQ